MKGQIAKSICENTHLHVDKMPNLASSSQSSLTENDKKLVQSLLQYVRELM